MGDVLARLEYCREEGRFGRMGLGGISRGVMGINVDFCAACGESFELEAGEVLRHAPVYTGSNQKTDVGDQKQQCLLFVTGLLFLPL